jgi:HlyD family secretion protein
MNVMAATSPQRKTESSQREQVARAIGLTKSKSRWWLWMLLPVLVLGGVAFFVVRQKSNATPVNKWATVAVDRGDLVTIASATGSLQPQRTIAVGAEVSGKIESVLVEPNDIVKEGQVLATFDKNSLQNSLQESSASLQAARADILRAKTTAAEAVSSESRTSELAQKGVASTKDLEAAKAASERAKADVKSAIAQEQLSMARLDTSRANLTKTVITSPIDGVVLTRNVEPGNTVAASFQSPELFTIAEDLKRMELHVAVDEADVGQVAEGQGAIFTVSTWPDREFKATVSKVYLAPTTTSNVVTYTVILAVDNEDSLLRPGMTATANITTGLEKNTLRAPNKALRFTPAKEATGFSFGPPQSKEHGKTPGVWVLQNGAPVKIEVVVGSSDGRYTSIKTDKLKDGDLIITGLDGGVK